MGAKAPISFVWSKYPMAQKTIQAVMIAWLLHTGHKHVKHMTGCEVFTKDHCGYWFIGTGGSVRYGRTRGTAANAPNRFAQITGISVAEITTYRRMPELEI